MSSVRVVLVVLVTVLAVGCSAPTSPTPAPAPSPAPVATVPPAPPPTPAPTPPTSVRYTATVTSAQWYGAPWFGDTFVVEKFADRVLVNGREFPAPVGNDAAWTTRLGNDAQFSVYEGGTWIFNGIAGQASGTLR